MVISPNSPSRADRVEPRPPVHRHGGIAALAAVLAATAFLGLRGWLLAFASVPRIQPDETGSWAIARYLAGRQPLINMFDMPPYSLGMGAILAPLELLVDDPVSRYRAGIVLSAALIAGAGLLTWLLVRRLADGAVVAPVVGACLVALLPATSMTGSFTWAEALCLLWLPLLGWLACRALSSGSWPTVVIAGVAFGGAPSVHGRFMPAPLVWVVALVAWAVWRARVGDGRRGVVCAVASGVITAVTFVGCRWVSAVVVDSVWSDVASEGTTAWLGHLGEPVFWKSLVLGGIGQLWYVGASTAGLAYLGLAWLGTELISTARRVEDRLTIGVVLGLTMSIIVVSTAFITGGYVEAGFQFARADYPVYGRYVDASAALLAAFGVVLLYQYVGRRFWLSAGLAGGSLLGLGLIVAERTDDLTAKFFGPTIAGLATLPFDGVVDAADLQIGAWLVVSLAAFAALVVASRLGPSALTGTVLALLIAGAFAGTNFAVYHHEKWRYDGLYEAVPASGNRPSRALIAADVASERAYRFTVYGQQFVLVDRGWAFERSPLSSAELVAQGGAGAGLVVLEHTVDARSAGWRSVGQTGPAKVWLTTP